VACANEVVEERCINVMGIDEAGNPKGEVSWISPVARALPKAWSVTW
jgi:transcription elongation factor GreB